MESNCGNWKWAEYAGQVFTARILKNEPPMHATWFDSLGIPSYGELYDTIPRGVATATPNAQFIDGSSARSIVIVSGSGLLGIPAAVWDFFRTTYPGYEMRGNGQPWDTFKPAQN